MKTFLKKTHLFENKESIGGVFLVKGHEKTQV